MNSILSLWQYSFIQRAVITGSFVGMLCAVLGLFLVLRKFSLIGDGLAHTSFAGVALGLFLGIFPLYAALPVAVIGSLIILLLSNKARIYGDTAIGIVSAVGISSAVMLASLSKGFNVDLMSYLFGNILAVRSSEMWASIVLAVLSLAGLTLLYHDLFALTFDETYAKSLGIKTAQLNTLFFILTAIVVVLAIQVVGIMLVSALLILPATTALQLARGFRQAILISISVSVFSIIFGIMISFARDLPTGATIVLLNFALFSIAWLSRTLARDR
ncbi:ABC transporter [Candidatus Wirthbacteria bacterium CG2_30_54_11]|uniref:ABC transporter n=1 Tax=Candidatus Wirthbacteria bacterium CG2_30_54_11 TaxID=1817892 RepID=A0A1J5IEV4_9BACT|nr:MAG: ABC transporter [Candidatus Wirthbacteria bacterium CG2_30_54_11]